MRESIRRKRNKYILKKTILKKEISHCQQTSHEYIERESMYIYQLENPRHQQCVVKVLHQCNLLILLLVKIYRKYILFCGYILSLQIKQSIAMFFLFFLRFLIIHSSRILLCGYFVIKWLKYWIFWSIVLQRSFHSCKLHGYLFFR